MHPPRTLSVALLLGSLLAAVPALGAGPESAEDLFDRGIRAMEAGRFDEACPALERSYKQDPRPGLLFTLAECEAQRGRFATAAAHYDAFLALYASLPPDKKAKQADREKAARSQRAALAAKIAELTVVLPPNAPRGTSASRDGAPLAESALGVPFPVDPGEHVLAVRAPDGTVTESRVTLAAGEKKAVALDVRQAGAAEKPAPALPAIQDQSTGPNKVLLGVGAAVAGAGIVAGAVLLGVSASKGSTVSALQNEIKQSGGCVGATAGGKCAELRDAGNAKATLGNAGLWTLVGGGVIGAGTLIYGLVAGSKSPAKTGVRVLPAVTGSGGGLVVDGVF